MRLLDIMTSPWAIVPDKLYEIKAWYEAHIRGEKIDIKAIRAKLEEVGLTAPKHERGYDVIDGVAVIDIMDVLTKTMTLFSYFFGGTATKDVAAAFKEALEDQDVSAIVLNIDSPGGTVDGTQELAEMIYSARGVKPVVTFTDGMIASAAYYIGAAADRVLISGDMTHVGSIGVVATHIDYSRALDKMGVKETEITAGKYKRIASQVKPLSKEGRAYLQDQVDHIYSVFVNDVAKYRGVSVETVLSDMADGRIFIGKQAIEAGLVDGVSTFDGLISELAGGDPVWMPREDVPPAAETTRNHEKETNMTLEELKNQHPDLYQAVFEEGKKAGYEEGLEKGKADGFASGAEAERERIKAVREQLMPGHEALIEELMFDGKTTGEQAAVKVLQAEKAKLANVKKNLDDDAVDPVDQPADDEPEDEATQFERAVAREMEGGLSKAQAMGKVAREHPELHQAWIQKINKR